MPTRAYSVQMPRLLIVRVGAMGDVLHALPAAAALRAAQPGWSIDWVVDERWQPLLTGDDNRGPVVDTSLAVPIKAWKAAPFSPSTCKSLLAFRKARGKYELCVDMQGTLRSSFIGWLASGRLIGYEDPRESFASAFYAQTFERKGTHVIDQGAALLGAAAGIPLTPVSPELPHIEWADTWATKLIAGKKTAVLAPRAGWPSKQWPAERFGELAIQLRGRGYSCLVNTPHTNDEVAASVVAASKGAADIVVCNVAGLVALLRQTKLFVGGDSGPMHLAATLGVPVVALFGPTNPARNGPWGWGQKVVLRDQASHNTYRRNGNTDPGLAKITVAQVLGAVDNLSSQI
jgi:heptosyltransferase-1